MRKALRHGSVGRGPKHLTQPGQRCILGPRHSTAQRAEDFPRPFGFRFASCGPWIPGKGIACSDPLQEPEGRKLERHGQEVAGLNLSLWSRTDMKPALAERTPMDGTDPPAWATRALPTILGGSRARLPPAPASLPPSPPFLTDPRPSYTVRDRIASNQLSSRESSASRLDWARTEV